MNTPPNYIHPCKNQTEEEDDDDEEEEKKCKRPPSSYGSMKSDSDEMEEEEEEEQGKGAEVVEAFTAPFPVALPESTTEEATGYCSLI